MSQLSQRALRPSCAAEKLGIALSTLWAKAHGDPDFPKPIKLGPRTTVFLEKEIDQWLEARAAMRARH